MDRFINLSEENRKAAFLKAKSEIGLPEDIIEKDFWVCWTLKELFLLDKIKHNLTFKGGTSLSKVYGLIKRFSEDIDISVERSFLGFVGEREPVNVSKKKAKKLIEELGEECQKFVQNDLLQKIDNIFTTKLSEMGDWKLEIDDDDNDGQTILFYYPKITKNELDYIRPVVKIELGARSDHWPVSIQNISPYIVEIMPDGLSDMTAQIRVLNVERTFWEKATILHKYAHYPEEKTVPERQSRHFYDFYCLLNSEAKEKALANIDLLEKVIAHKSLYFRSAWANYDTAKRGTFKAIPEKRVLDAMEKDYSAMSEMFFEEVPRWSEIIDALKLFEEEFNKGHS
jgi:predicted nucleotidyltransferase component of viral defense system